jgi:hypothetical protein
VLFLIRGNLETRNHRVPFDIIDSIGLMDFRDGYQEFEKYWKFG